MNPLTEVFPQIAQNLQFALSIARIFPAAVAAFLLIYTARYLTS